MLFPSFRRGHLRLRPPGGPFRVYLKCRASQRVQTAYRAITPAKIHEIALRKQGRRKESVLGIV